MKSSIALLTAMLLPSRRVSLKASVAEVPCSTQQRAAACN